MVFFTQQCSTGNGRIPGCKFIRSVGTRVLLLRCYYYTRACTAVWNHAWSMATKTTLCPVVSGASGAGAAEY